MSSSQLRAVYGAPPSSLVDVSPDAIQLSPLLPGSTPLEGVDTGSLENACVLAPHGSRERGFVLAHILRALAPGGRLLVLAPKDKGGARLADELSRLGCEPSERFKARHRICEVERPAGELPLGEAIEAGAPRYCEALGLWTQPGIFSFDRVDPGSALLLAQLRPLAGRGADLGSGLGVLSRAILASEKIEELSLVEIDRRALDASRRNVVDERARFHWLDARDAKLSALDFVVSNPPFHAGGQEDRALGQDFIRAAGAMLRKGGTLHLVANRHLPYEAVLRERFRKVDTIAEAHGYKLFEAGK